MQPSEIEGLSLTQLVGYMSECQGGDTMTFATEQQYMAHLGRSFGK